MADRSRALLQHIDALYDAVDAPEQWDATWRGLMRFFGAETGCLYLEAPPTEATPTTFLAMPGFSDKALALYGQHYINVDPYAAFTRFAGKAAVMLSQEIISPARFAETEVWRDYSRTHVGAFHILGAVMPAVGGEFARTAVHRPHDAKPFGPTERNLYASLLPHLSRSLQLRSKLLQERKAAGDYAAALNAMASAIIVVDRFARPHFRNTSAERLGADRHILFGRAGAELHLPSLAETRRLRTLISDVTQGGAGGAMIATGADGMARLAFSVSRMPNAARSQILARESSKQFMALLVIRDVSTAVELHPGALVSLFGLTVAEAEVARDLASGHRAEDIANKRDRSMSTVRTQIRHVLSKTGAASTTHLVSMLSRLQGG